MAKDIIKEDFDSLFYYGAYVDLRKAFGYNPTRLYQHWLTFGKKEGRRAIGADIHYIYNEIDYTAEFDPKFYYDAYPDLQKAFGYDRWALLQHWHVFGKKEGRIAKKGVGPTPTPSGKKTAKQAIFDALTALREKDKYAYFNGAWGQKLTKSTMDYFWTAADSKAHFARYTPAEKEQIYKNSINKIGYDCAGFTGWVCTGDKRYGPGQIANSTPCDFNTPGAILFTTFGGKGRHIGFSLGNGFCLHMGNESTDANIQQKKDTVRLDRIEDIAWERAGKSNVLDYEN